MPSAFARLASGLAALQPGDRVAFAEAAAVDPRLAHRLAKAAGRDNVRAFQGDAFTGLCRRFGIDPLTGEDIAPQDTGPFSWASLGCAVRMVRIGLGLSLREAAVAFAVERTAMTRMEHGIPVSVDPLLAMCRAISRHPFDFLLPPKFHGKHKVHQSETTTQTQKVPA